MRRKYNIFNQFDMKIWKTLRNCFFTDYNQFSKRFRDISLSL